MSQPVLASAHNPPNPLPKLVDAIGQRVQDKPAQIRLALAAFLSGGHVLIEDAPGMGKTSLARALGFHLSLDWKRLQCTNDTTPSDIVGVTIFDPQNGGFTFRHGPIFTQLLLADELNRAPSKSQSALLEAMAEGQVTSDGNAYELPDIFLVIATQNPLEQVGVSPLPESQLDRFAVSFSLGLPSPQAEQAILRDAQARAQSQTNDTPIITAENFRALQKAVAQIGFGAPIVAYLQQLAAHLRENSMPDLSVRALIQIKGLAQAHAYIEMRDYCIPEDIQAVLVGALRHRMGLRATEAETHIRTVIDMIAVP